MQSAIITTPGYPSPCLPLSQLTSGGQTSVWCRCGPSGRTGPHLARGCPFLPGGYMVDGGHHRGEEQVPEHGSGNTSSQVLKDGKLKANFYLDPYSR